MSRARLGLSDSQNPVKHGKRALSTRHSLGFFPPYRAGKESIMKCIINIHGVICDSLEGQRKGRRQDSSHHGKYGATGHTIACSPS
jgi:hypothetical protein